VIVVESQSVLPAAPETLQETGVGMDMVLQLVTKTLHFAGELTGTDLSARLGVGFHVIEPALGLLKRERQCEISGGTTLGPPSYGYRLTDAGRSRAALFLEQNQYVGHLPVPLDAYVAHLRQHGRDASLSITKEAVRKAFAHLVLNERVLDQLGPALAARHSLFIYGPPGNGKTVISQAIGNLLTGEIAVPHAIAVDGHIIRLFDPVIHQPIPADTKENGLMGRSEDNRWVRCRRPLVTVGGELTLDALELGYSSDMGFYHAPLQALANGGVLVIDDFGRQHASPRDLLNRWIVPLETRVDYLTLQTGQKFQMPFEVLIVFATNLRPAELVDEAFLRRIQYKVFAQSPTIDEFIRIFENCCRDRQIAFDDTLVHAFIEKELRSRNVLLRGCQPRDLIDHAIALAGYLGQPQALTEDLLAAASASYFVDDREVDPA
jgi:hypothetical protein